MPNRPLQMAFASRVSSAACNVTTVLRSAAMTKQVFVHFQALLSECYPANEHLQALVLVPDLCWQPSRQTQSHLLHSIGAVIIVTHQACNEYTLPQTRSLGTPAGDCNCVSIPYQKRRMRQRRRRRCHHSFWACTSRAPQSWYLAALHHIKQSMLTTGTAGGRACGSSRLNILRRGRRRGRRWGWGWRERGRRRRILVGGSCCSRRGGSVPTSACVSSYSGSVA